MAKLYDAGHGMAMMCGGTATLEEDGDGKPAYGIRHTSRTEEQKGNGKPISTLSFYKYEGQMSKANDDDPS